VGSGNQEVYLANASFKDNAQLLTKLVDTYPSSGSPILRAVLMEHRALEMTLIRNPECDVTAHTFFLGSGDRNIFDQRTRSTLSERASESVPCFTVIHEATRLKK
jgi:hypothetical protein